MRSNSVEISTKSTPGSMDLVRVMFYSGSDSKIAAIFIQFSDPIVFAIGFCTKSSLGEGEAFDVAIPATENNEWVWKISKDTVTIRLFCNGVLMARRNVDTYYQGDANCINRWTKHAQKLMFPTINTVDNGPDTASNQYRIISDGKLVVEYK